jgi:preprotein translocase subunit SecB
MDTAKTGISMQSIYVDRIDYNLDVGDQPPSINDSVDVELRTEIINHDPVAFVRLTIDCMHPKEKSTGHRLSASIVAAYRRDSKTPTVDFDKFLAINAPTALFAFVRELVYSVTSRSPIPPILLDPVNMYRILNEGYTKFSQPQISSEVVTTEQSAVEITGP